MCLGFADGERAEADVLIGADGIHSVIRAALTEPAPPTHSGMCAFRALVPAAAPARAPIAQPRFDSPYKRYNSPNSSA